MEEINIKEFLDFVKEKILIVLIAVLSCVALVLIYDGLIKTKKYSTYTTIALVKTNSDNATITQSDIQVNQNLVNTYSHHPLPHIKYYFLIIDLVYLVH